jgi:hypothetical protein
MTMKAFWRSLTIGEMQLSKTETALTAVATWVFVFVCYHTFVVP